MIYCGSLGEHRVAVGLLGRRVGEGREIDAGARRNLRASRHRRACRTPAPRWSPPSASATRSAHSAATTTQLESDWRDEISQQLAARRGIERHRHRAELAETPDGPDEFRAIRQHDRDMVALADAELAKAIGVAVGKIVRLRIGIALLAEDQPGPVADARRPCPRADVRWCVVSADSRASFRHRDRHRPERSNVRIFRRAPSITTRPYLST